MKDLLQQIKEIAEINRGGDWDAFSKPISYIID